MVPLLLEVLQKLLVNWDSYREFGERKLNGFELFYYWSQKKEKHIINKEEGEQQYDC